MMAFSSITKEFGVVDRRQDFSYLSAINLSAINPLAPNYAHQHSDPQVQRELTRVLLALALSKHCITRSDGYTKERMEIIAYSETPLAPWC